MITPLPLIFIYKYATAITLPLPIKHVIARDKIIFVGF